MKTKTAAETEQGITRVVDDKNWRDISTDALIGVCRLLVKRADSLALDPDELEKLRLVAAELRRRRRPLPGEVSEPHPSTMISTGFVDEPYVLIAPGVDQHPPIRGSE